MTTLEAIQILEKITFLDWEFRIDLEEPIDTHTNGVCNAQLYIKHNVPNTQTHRRERIELTFNMLINIERLDESEFIREVYNCILKRLRHEAAELLKVNGKAPFDEHELNSIASNPYYSLEREPKTRESIRGCLMIDQMMATNFCGDCDLDMHKHNIGDIRCSCGRKFVADKNGRIEYEVFTQNNAYDFKFTDETKTKVI